MSPKEVSFFKDHLKNKLYQALFCDFQSYLNKQISDFLILNETPDGVHAGKIVLYPIADNTAYSMSNSWVSKRLKIGYKIKEGLEEQAQNLVDLKLKFESDQRIVNHYINRVLSRCNDYNLTSAVSYFPDYLAKVFNEAIPYQDDNPSPIFVVKDPKAFALMDFYVMTKLITQ